LRSNTKLAVAATEMAIDRMVGSPHIPYMEINYCFTAPGTRGVQEAVSFGPQRAKPINRSHTSEFRAGRK